MKPKERLKELPYVSMAGLAAILFGILGLEFAGSSSIPIYATFIAMIGIWIFILLEGTNRSALNYPSKPIHNGANLLSLVLLECTLAFSIFYLYRTFGVLGGISMMLFAPVAIGMAFHSVKASGYCILLPLAFSGGVSVEAKVYSLVLPNGQLLALFVHVRDRSGW